MWPKDVTPPTFASRALQIYTSRHTQIQMKMDVLAPRWGGWRSEKQSEWNKNKIMTNKIESEIENWSETFRSISFRADERMKMTVCVYRVQNKLHKKAFPVQVIQSRHLNPPPPPHTHTHALCACDHAPAIFLRGVGITGATKRSVQLPVLGNERGGRKPRVSEYKLLPCNLLTLPQLLPRWHSDVLVPVPMNLRRTSSFHLSHVCSHKLLTSCE